MIRVLEWHDVGSKEKSQRRGERARNTCLLGHVTQEASHSTFAQLSQGIYGNINPMFTFPMHKVNHSSVITLAASPALFSFL